jgi:hypothetical protein
VQFYEEGVNNSFPKGGGFLGLMNKYQLCRNYSAPSVSFLAEGYVTVCCFSDSYICTTFNTGIYLTSGGRGIYHCAPFCFLITQIMRNTIYFVKIFSDFK